MPYAERQQAERRRAAIDGWRELGRRAEDRRLADNALCARWIDRFETARRAA